MGVPTKKTPYEVSEASDVVITMLPSSAHVSIVIPVAFPFAANTHHIICGFSFLYIVQQQQLIL